MAVMFSHGDIVEWGKDFVMCVVLSSVPILGFNLYTVMEVDSGVTHRNVGAHELKSLSDDLGEINLPSEMVTEPSASVSTERFPCITDEDVLGLQAKRTSKSTDAGTRWGVKIFKGMDSSQ